ncbi:hypothetical protein GCM10022291_21670 [Postechiella marina]|uniref:3-keto-alpha-glucoside-1,2-lyase/3-keto-2-hydroxy-glucal hydratase domain-containing protein n=1 Tax=Postechiella marina TaxID=943941 RepID=A0ABP8CAR3_9FLAO
MKHIVAILGVGIVFLGACFSFTSSTPAPKNVFITQPEGKYNCESPSETQDWINPFPKGGLGTVYTTSEKVNPQGNKLFKVKQNSIEVLYDWKGNKAPFGIITTKKAYSAFNLELEYKWGKRKFAPRLNAKRDAGILFHIQGKKVVWPSSLECQIQENDTGDLWVIKGPKVTVIEKDSTETILDSGGEQSFLQNVKYDNYETSSWNKIRLEVRGAESAKFFVNDKLVNEIKDFKDNAGKVLNKGLIALQAEGAELTYRNVKIQEVK